MGLALFLQFIKLSIIGGFKLAFHFFVLTIPLLVIIEFHRLLVTLMFGDICHSLQQLFLEILFLHEGALELAARVVLGCLDLFGFGLDADDAVEQRFDLFSQLLVLLLQLGI